MKVTERADFLGLRKEPISEGFVSRVPLWEVETRHEMKLPSVLLCRRKCCII